MSFWENFGDIFWWFFCAFVFCAYLIAIFAVIGDLFPTSTSGTRPR